MPTLNSEDIYLLLAESLRGIGFLVSFCIAVLICKKNRTANVEIRGWFLILFGLFLGIFHSLFDMLDTLDWGNGLVNDWLNVVDGLFFFSAILLLGIGIMIIVKTNIKAWGLDNG